MKNILFTSFSIVLFFLFIGCEKEKDIYADGVILPSCEDLILSPDEEDIDCGNNIGCNFCNFIIFDFNQSSTGISNFSAIYNNSTSMLVIENSFNPNFYFKVNCSLTPGTYQFESETKYDGCAISNVNNVFEITYVDTARKKIWGKFSFTCNYTSSANTISNGRFYALNYL